MSDPNSISKRRKWLTAYAPLAIWIGVILFLGSSQGSMNRTSIIIRPLLEFLCPTATPETITFYHGIVRKCAHFAEYGLLGILACRAFVRANAELVRKYSFPLAIALVLVVATTDEFIQSFNPERTSSPYDVLLDFSGGLIATILYWLLSNRRRRAS